MDNLLENVLLERRLHLGMDCQAVKNKKSVYVLCLFYNSETKITPTSISKYFYDF